MTRTKSRILMRLPPRSSCDPGDLRRGDSSDFLRRLRQTRLFALGTDRETFGVNEMHVAHAEEREKIAHVAGLRVDRSAGVLTAARREHIHLLARQVPDRPLLRVPERNPRPGNVIEIRLELRWDAEVVHGKSDHDD